MTLKAWAEKLTGREYYEELTRGEEAQLKAESYVAAFGASDDLLEFRGAIHDEAGAWNGASVKLCQKQNGEFDIFREDKNSETAEFNRFQISCMQGIKAVWYPANEKTRYGHRGILSLTICLIGILTSWKTANCFAAGRYLAQRR